MKTIEDAAMNQDNSDGHARGFMVPILGGIGGLMLGSILGGGVGAVVGGVIGSITAFLIFCYLLRSVDETTAKRKR